MRGLLLVFLVACTSSSAPAPVTPTPDASPEPEPEPEPQPEPVPAADHILYERFDAMPTGATPAAPWTATATNGGAVAVREVPFAADKSAEISKPAGAGASTLTYRLEPRGGRVVFEAKVLARETAGFKAIPYIYDPTGAAVATVSFQDGSIRAHVGTTKTTIQPFVADTWYRVRVVVDTTLGSFDLYVDGVRKLRAQPLRTPAATVGSFAYYLDGEGAGTLVVDQVRVYAEDVLIAAPPEPAFDPRDFGAAGNGSTDDTVAVQRAIDAAAAARGSAVLTHGTYKTGTLVLRSHLTLFIAPSATLLGSTDPAAYPAQSPATGNTQRSNIQRALLYAAEVTDLRIDGGGTIDGNGDAFPGAESARPSLLWTVLSQGVQVRNLYLARGAVWSLVTMETDDVAISNINLSSTGITHDGIDIVDGARVEIHDVTVNAGDDAMCLKTGVRRGVEELTIRDSFFSGSNGGSNGIKFGTASYGAFRRIAIRDSYIKNIQHAAIAVESRQGADVADVRFHRIELANTGAAFFIYLAQQNRTHPAGDVPKLGTMDGVTFRDIKGRTGSWARSPHQGSLITGHIFEGVTYPIRNLTFENVDVTFTGGRDAVPGAPPEAIPDQYPESNMFGDLPAWGYYLRHVDGVTFTNCRSTSAAADARPALVTDDVARLAGTP